jgi:regulator of sirC expression with transglutaminase-like and TPR domain
VEAPRLSDAERIALLDLLDDPSPVVRQALLAQLIQLGDEGVALLQAAIAGQNRVLAQHARWYLQELHFRDPVTEFRGYIRSPNLDLETGALLLGRTVNPALQAEACTAFLDQLAARCLELLPDAGSVRAQCQVINRVLFREYGFRGNTDEYADPRNSHLDLVLQRRTGIPISLCTVYLLVARRLGLRLEPVGAPGHFLVGCYTEEAPFFIDAFREGTFLSAGDVFTMLRQQHLSPRAADLAPTPVREVLCRWCRNLVNHYSAAGDTAHARMFAGFVAEFDGSVHRPSQA